jgi:beta-lactamase regulating signal transducer with metallopeptidase domain
MTAYVIPLIATLGWTLIQSLWQALVIFVILRALLALLPHAPAAARYNLSLGALALTLAAFVLTFYSRWASLQPPDAFYQAGSAAASPFGAPPAGAAAFASSASWFSPERWLTIVAVLYLGGLIFFAGKMIRDAAFLWYLRGGRRPPLDPGWERCLAALCASWGLARNVRLYVSRRVDVPVVAGYLKPVIYLPFTLSGLEAGQVEAILLHELAHIRRGDFLVNVLQTLAETLLFFNPFVWLMSRAIRTERENCCDDLVLSRLDPGIYASALLALEENRKGPVPLMLAATGNKKQQLFQRIKRIMEMKTKKLNVLQKLLVLMVLSCSLLSLGWLAPDRKAADTAVTTSGHTAVPASGVAAVKDTSTPAWTAADSTPPAMKLPPPPPPPSVLPPPPPRRPAKIDTATSSRAYTIKGHPAKDKDSALRPYTVKGFPMPPDSLRSLTQTYFQSPEWKLYQQQLARYAADMARYAARYGKDAGAEVQRYFNSPEWMKYQQELHQYTQDLNAYFHSKEWQANVETIKRQAMDMRRQFADVQFHTTLDSLKSRFPAFTFASDSHTINADRIASMLLQDGLIKDSDNFRMRLNDKGLFVNGKKQDRKYFDKYRRLAGPATHIEIKRKNGNTDTSISTHRKNEGH